MRLPTMKILLTLTFLYVFIEISETSKFQRVTRREVPFGSDEHIQLHKRFINSGGRVLHGKDYKKQTTPHVRVLAAGLPNDKGRIECAGILVEKDFVYSAASCFLKFFQETNGNGQLGTLVDPNTLEAEYYDSSNYYVDTPIKKQNGPGGKDAHSQVKRMFHAPGFNWYFPGSNIASLKLKKEINNPSTQPAPICKKNSYIGHNMFMLGSGVIEAQGGQGGGAGTTAAGGVQFSDPPNPIIRSMEVVEMDFNSCYQELEAMNGQNGGGSWSLDKGALNSTSACFKAVNGPQNSGACYGDVGGGIYVEENNQPCLFAVISDAFICQGQITLGTRVQPFDSFLRSMAKKLIDGESVNGGGSSTESKAVDLPKMSYAGLVACLVLATSFSKIIDN